MLAYCLYVNFGCLDSRDYSGLEYGILKSINACLTFFNSVLILHLGGHDQT